MATKKSPKKEVKIDPKETEVKVEKIQEQAKQVTKREPKKAPVVLSTRERKALTEEMDVEEKMESTLNKIENYLYMNGKKMLWALAIVVLIVCGVLAYKYVYLPNKSESAGAEMFVAEQNFKAELYQEALQGDGNNVGFIEVAQKYGATPQGNLANHYAGICYLKMGELDSAMEWLKRYDSKSGVPDMNINAQNIGLQGDIYSQKKEYEKAVECYEEAVKAVDNSLITPIYLMKLARVYNVLNRAGDAVDVLQRVKDNYPASIEAREVEKFLGATKQGVEE